MKDLNKTIKHFESLQKRYTTQHNGEMCKRTGDALEALYQLKNQQDMKSYCEGTHCSKRDKCALHQIEENKIYEYIDWSNYGSSRYWNDPDGTPRCEVEHSCGDLGDFKHFIDATTTKRYGIGN